MNLRISVSAPGVMINPASSLMSLSVSMDDDVWSRSEDSLSICSSVFNHSLPNLGLQLQSPFLPPLQSSPRPQSDGCVAYRDDEDDIYSPELSFVEEPKQGSLPECAFRVMNPDPESDPEEDIHVVRVSNVARTSCWVIEDANDEFLIAPSRGRTFTHSPSFPLATRNRQYEPSPEPFCDLSDDEDDDLAHVGRYDRFWHYNNQGLSGHEIDEQEFALRGPVFTGAGLGISIPSPHPNLSENITEADHLRLEVEEQATPSSLSQPESWTRMEHWIQTQQATIGMERAEESECDYEEGVWFADYNTEPSSLSIRPWVPVSGTAVVPDEVVESDEEDDQIIIPIALTAPPSGDTICLEPRRRRPRSGAISLHGHRVPDVSCFVSPESPILVQSKTIFPLDLAYTVAPLPFSTCTSHAQTLRTSSGPSSPESTATAISAYDETEAKIDLLDVVRKPPLSCPLPASPMLTLEIDSI